MTTKKELNRNITHQLNHIGHLNHRRHAHKRGPGGPGMDATRGQGRVLALLALKPEMSQKDLTFLLGMRQQSATELLAKLEEKGFIERTRDEADKRKVVVKLTKEGEAEAAKAKDEPKEQYLDCLTNEEKTTLSGYLERIIERLEEEVGEENPEEWGDRREAMEEMFGGKLPPDFPGFPPPRGPRGPHGHRGHRDHHGSKRGHHHHEPHDCHPRH